MENQSAPKAYSYLRFSTPEQAKGDSYRRQTDAAEYYAKQHGLVLDEELRMADEGVSAYRAANVKTGALGRFLRAIEDGLVPEKSFLLVENLDRISRSNPWDAMPVFQQIINAGVTIVTLQDGKSWSREEIRDNPFRIFESVMVMIRSHEESATKGRRLREAWRSKRERAGRTPMTACAPAWLRLDKGANCFIVDEQRASVVRRIFALTLEGRGQHAIAEMLNRRDEPCFGRGKYWHRSYIKKILAGLHPVPKTPS